MQALARITSNMRSAMLWTSPLWAAPSMRLSADKRIIEDMRLAFGVQGSSPCCSKGRGRHERPPRMRRKSAEISLLPRFCRAQAGAHRRNFAYSCVGTKLPQGAVLRLKMQAGAFNRLRRRAVSRRLPKQVKRLAQLQQRKVDEIYAENTAFYLKWQIG